MNPDNPNFRTPEEEARAAEFVRMKAEFERQAKVIEKLRKQRNNAIWDAEYPEGPEIVIEFDDQELETDDPLLLQKVHHFAMVNRVDLTVNSMDPIQYTKEAALTDHPSYDPVIERITNDQTARLLHYALGLGSETGELQDALKKLVAYGKSLDLVNVKEEIGDLLWYMSRIADTCGFTLEEAMATNIAKLKARYGDKWTQQAALNRDLKLEREVLEK